MSIDAEFTATVKKNHAFNSRVVWCDAAFFGLGFAVFTPFTILPGFIRHFTANPMAINMIMAIFSAGLFGPQIVSSLLYDSYREKRAPFMRWSFLFRLLIMPLIIAAFLAYSHPRASLLIFFGFYAASGLCWGMATLLWQELLGRWLEDTRRPMVIGIRFFTEQSATLIGGIGVAAILGAVSFPHNYAILFIAGSVFWWLSFFFLSYAREAAYPNPNSHHSVKSYATQLLGIVKTDSSFRAYVVFAVLASSFSMAISLFTTHGMDVFFGDSAVQGRDRFAGMANILNGLSFAIGALVNGWVSRYKSPIWGQALGCMFWIAASVNAACASTLWWYSLTFVCAGLSLGFTLVSMISMVLLFSAPHYRSRYIAITNTSRGVAGFIFPFVGGYCAARMGPHIVFISTAVLTALAWYVLVAHVRIPSAQEIAARPE